MTFRHDEIDLPARGTLASSQADAARVTAEPKAARPQPVSPSKRPSLNLDAARGLHGKLFVTWAVAALVSGAVSLFLRSEPRISRSPAHGFAATGTPSTNGLATGVEPASVATKPTEPEPLVEPKWVKDSASNAAGRWDSHVALSRGDIALETAKPKDTEGFQTGHLAAHRSPQGRARTAPRSGAVSAQSRRGHSQKALAPVPSAASLSVLDVPIAPPEN